jgi:hypothetical protein
VRRSAWRRVSHSAVFTPASSPSTKHTDRLAGHPTTGRNRRRSPTPPTADTDRLLSLKRHQEPPYGFEPGTDEVNRPGESGDFYRSKVVCHGPRLPVQSLMSFWTHLCADVWFVTEFEVDVLPGSRRTRTSAPRTRCAAGKWRMPDTKLIKSAGPAVELVAIGNDEGQMI